MNFGIMKDLRQRNQVSSVPFNLVLEELSEEVELTEKEIIFNNNHQCMAFVDDVALIAKSKKRGEREFSKR